MNQRLDTVATILVFSFLTVAGLTGCGGEAPGESSSGPQTEQQEHGHTHGDEGHTQSDGEHTHGNEGHTHGEEGGHEH